MYLVFSSKVNAGIKISLVKLILELVIILLRFGLFLLSG